VGIVRRSSLALAVVAMVVAGVALAYLAYATLVVVDTRDVAVRFTVVEKDHIGFDLDRDTLAFGKVPQGGGAERIVTLQSSVPAWASIRFSDEISPYVLARPSPKIRLSPGVPANVTIALEVPSGMPLGNYTGTARVAYTRTLPWR
jgi:hypothetical protein